MRIDRGEQVSYTREKSEVNGASTLIVEIFTLMRNWSY